MAHKLGFDTNADLADASLSIDCDSSEAFFMCAVRLIVHVFRKM